MSYALLFIFLKLSPTAWREQAVRTLKSKALKVSWFLFKELRQIWPKLILASICAKKNSTILINKLIHQLKFILSDNGINELFRHYSTFDLRSLENLKQSQYIKSCRIYNKWFPGNFGIEWNFCGWKKIQKRNLENFEKKIKRLWLKFLVQWKEIFLLIGSFTIWKNKIFPHFFAVKICLNCSQWFLAFCDSLNFKLRDQY